MANTVTVSALGAENKTLNDIDTVRDAAEALNLSEEHSVIVNGEAADYDTELSDFNFVAFGEQVKGGDSIGEEAWANSTSYDVYAYL